MDWPSFHLSRNRFKLCFPKYPEGYQKYKDRRFKVSGHDYLILPNT